MDRSQDKPISGNGTHLVGNTSRRKARVRRGAEATHLRLVRPGDEALAPPTPPYHPPVRASAPVRPEWAAPLSAELVDLPDPTREPAHLEAAIDLLRRAAQATTVSERGDAVLVAVEHAARCFAEMFDRETTRKLLRDVADGL